MLSAEDFERALNPHRKEIARLIKEIEDKNKYTENYSYINDCFDMIYALLFDTSLITAKLISHLEEKLEKEPFLKGDNIPKIIEHARMTYSKMSEGLKRIRESQQKYDLTNAPTE